MDIDLRRKIDTEANLLSNLASGKLGIASDTNNIIFVEASDKGTIVPDKVGATYRDRTFGAVTAQATTTAALTSVGNISIGADTTNKLVIESTLCYLMAGGEKIIDYLQTNGIIDINAGLANIDTAINGTGATPVIYVDASANNIGVGIITPAEKIHISAAAAGYIRIANTADTLAVIGGIKFTIAGSETARIEAERTVSSGRGSVLKFSTGNSTAITERLRIDDTGGIQINESGAAVDVRIEGDTDVNLFITDGSADKVGIGVAAPSEKLEVSTSAAAKSAVKISGGIGGENNGGLILNDTFDFRSSAIIGNILFNAKLNDGATQPETTFAQIAAFVGSNAASNYESYLSFRTTGATGVIGSRMAVRHNKIDIYEDVDIESGNVIKVNGTQVLTGQQAAIANATDAASTQARLNDLLAALRTHGIIAT